MKTSMDVQQYTVRALLQECSRHPILIPDYQREYSWKEKNILNLIEDIRQFSEEKGTNNEYYFLGSIVVFENTDGMLEVIDGQQRLTSLFLLLRAVYYLLEQKDKDSLTTQDLKFKIRIGELIWEEKNGEPNQSAPFLRSEVNDDELNQILLKLLEDGKPAESDDSYTVNYKVIIDELKEIEESSEFYDFINAVLDDVTLSVFTANNQDMALTIFSTLNDRGMPLTDADIFKAKIYRNLPDTQKKQFVKDWKELQKKAKSLKLDLQQIFQLHSFYDRCCCNVRDNRYNGLRRWYQRNDYERLYRADLLDELDQIIRFLSVISKHEQYPDEPWTDNPEIRKILDILSYYPNQNWREAALSYYLIHHSEPGFQNNYLAFLKKLTADLTIAYLVGGHRAPTQTAFMDVHDEIAKSNRPSFSFVKGDLNKLDGEIIRNNTRYLNRLLLAILATTHQDHYLPGKWEIEHILPKNFKKLYKDEEEQKYVNGLIEHLGNKLPIEKRNNIQASDGFFNYKKSIYRKSNFGIVQEMAERTGEDWGPKEILERDQEIIEEFHHIFQDWDYENRFDFDHPETHEKNDVQEKRKPFRFSMVDVKPGEKIYLSGHPDVTAIVVDDKTILFNGMETSLSKAAQDALGSSYQPQGPAYWIYNGESLENRRKRMEENE